MYTRVVKIIFLQNCGIALNWTINETIAVLWPLVCLLLILNLPLVIELH